MTLRLDLPMRYSNKRPMPTHASLRIARAEAGFTLIELMIVTVIIAILVSIGIPQYNDYLIKGKLAEASNLLSELQIRQEQYYLDNRAYANGMSPRATSTVFSASCAISSGGQGYTCTATPLASSGIGFVFSVNETGTKSTSAASPALSGWTLPASSCWAKSKSGAC